MHAEKPVTHRVARIGLVAGAHMVSARKSTGRVGGSDTPELGIELAGIARCRGVILRDRLLGPCLWIATDVFHHGMEEDYRGIGVNADVTNVLLADLRVDRARQADCALRAAREYLQGKCSLVEQRAAGVGPMLF